LLAETFAQKVRHTPFLQQSLPPPVQQTLLTIQILGLTPYPLFPSCQNVQNKYGQRPSLAHVGSIHASQLDQNGWAKCLAGRNQSRHVLAVHSESLLYRP